MAARCAGTRGQIRESAHRREYDDGQQIEKGTSDASVHGPILRKSGATVRGLAGCSCGGLG